MAGIVVKFGGSNLKEKKDYLKILQAVVSYNTPVTIVVSAFYGLTNKLSSLIKTANCDTYKTSQFLKELSSQKEEIISNLIEQDKLREQLQNEVNKRIHDLERLFEGIRYIGEVPEAIEDLILSYGERLSSIILSYVLKDNGIDAIEQLPEEIGLLTDGDFSNATVNYEASSESINVHLQKNRTVVIPGFYGITEKGRVSLLGRGGSDYSAAAIAHCIEADSLDVWKDVNGFLSADPKIVDNAQRIESLNYSEAAELAYFGAQILHPRTVEPLQEKGIPIRIFNIDETEDINSPKSIISNEEQQLPNIIKSVTYSDDFAILKLKGPGVGIKPGILGKVATTLDKADINIKSVITSQIAINILLSAKDARRAKDILNILVLNGVCEIEINTNVAVIAAIGNGITQKHGVAAKIFSATAEKQINIQTIAFGASLVSAYFIVDKKDKEATIQAIHAELFIKSKIEYASLN